MQAAIAAHDDLAIEETTVRIREDFWASWGEPTAFGAQILRQQYASLLADRVILRLRKGGVAELRWTATYRQIWSKLTGKLTGH